MSAPETGVWICQCLCPQRHAIVAMAGEADDQAMAERTLATPLRKQVEAMCQAGTINPWCGLCHASSDTWQYEARRMKFASMDEAVPALRRLEAEQAMARAVWGDMARSD